MSKKTNKFYTKLEPNQPKQILAMTGCFMTQILDIRYYQPEFGIQLVLDSEKFGFQFTSYFIQILI